jgi:hypothetical protein
MVFFDFLSEYFLILISYFNKLFQLINYAESEFKATIWADWE